MNSHSKFDAFVADSDTEVTDQLLSTSNRNRSKLTLWNPPRYRLPKQRSNSPSTEISYAPTYAIVWEGGTPIIFSEGDLRTFFRTQTSDEQLVVPSSLQDRLLCISHYSMLSGHPGGRRLYLSLCRSFYWPSMAPEC